MLPLVRRITTAAELQAVTAAAQADNHAVLAPTHAVYGAEGRVVGYVSILALPMVHIWTDSKACSARDSLQLAQIDAIVSDRGAAEYLIPCSETSPYFPLMERFGFERVGRVILYRKRIKHVP
jgi:hypothetical protein